MNRWCAARQIGRGETVDVDRTWRLAQRWYAGRLDEAWAPRSPEAAEQLLSEAGLTGDFWRMK